MIKKAKKIAVFHGSPRKGNTYYATKVFMDELLKCGDVDFIEFFTSEALPSFCSGFTMCLCGLLEKCPNARYIVPILEKLLRADSIIFATPHYGACSMPGIMKNLFDHLDFLALHVSPRTEIFDKKAFIITTGAGSTAAIKPIKNVLKHWGINRVYSLGIRMLTNKWDKMSESKQMRYDRLLRKAARCFYKAKKGRPYISTIFFYYVAKFIVKKHIGEGNYPYEYWKAKGYFNKRPF
jgi:multimeric flavodoxin WrbA